MNEHRDATYWWPAFRLETSWRVARAVGIALLGASPVFATPPSNDHLAATFEILSTGPSIDMEIELRPTEPFDTVTVEAASGVASLNPACSFNDVVKGGSYVCRINVAGTSTDAALTINVVGQRALGPAKPSFVEVSNFTMVNPSFVPSKTNTSTMQAPTLISSPGRTSQ
jgi:hypothetical protein